MIKKLIQETFNFLVSDPREGQIQKATAVEGKELQRKGGNWRH